MFHLLPFFILEHEKQQFGSFRGLRARENALDIRLYEASLAGSAATLLELLCEDELILDRALVASISDTPLHIAAILGYIDFAREILAHKWDCLSCKSFFKPNQKQVASRQIKERPSY